MLESSTILESSVQGPLELLGLQVLLALVNPSTSAYCAHTRLGALFVRLVCLLLITRVLLML